MKFFDFGGFDYYALIGAVSKEAAIDFYKNTVADIDNDQDIPIEITEDEAKSKVLSICSDEQQKKEAIENFIYYAAQTEPWLLLVDPNVL